MSRTYPATGIIIKGMPLGEADRLVTILTPDFGLLRAIAPGARKQQSQLRGRSELFVVNELMLSKGRSLDRITQAETITSYAGLSKDLGKLSASQYLAELVLGLGLSDHPQQELYHLFIEHLRRIEQLAPNDYPAMVAHLAHAIFHLLAIAGIAPQFHTCCITQKTIFVNLDNHNWQIGFSCDAGGIVTLESDQDLVSEPVITPKSPTSVKVNTQLGIVELTLLQHLGAKILPNSSQILPGFLESNIDQGWINVERVLRLYIQHHLGRNIRSATLIDSLYPLEF